MVSPSHGNVSTDAVRRLMNIREPILESPEEMFRALKVGFFPNNSSSPAVHDFLSVLEKFLSQDLGNVSHFSTDGSEQLEPHVAYFFPGRGMSEREAKLPIDYGIAGSLSNIRHIPINAVVDMPENLDGMGKEPFIDALVQQNTWQMATNILWVRENEWAFSSLNGSALSHRWSRELLTSGPDDPVYQAFRRDFIETVATKTKVLVVPPDMKDFLIRQGDETLEERAQRDEVMDLVRVGALLASSDVFPRRRAIDSFQFSKPYHRRIAGVYLDERNGMSYGYGVRISPIRLEELLRRDELNARLASSGRKIAEEGRDYFVDDAGGLYLHISIPQGRLIPPGKEGAYYMKVPEVWLYSSISGSDKTKLDVTKIIRQGLVNGQMVIELPRGQGELPAGFRPSFDTMVINGTALGLAVYGGVLKHFKPKAYLVERLEKYGWALGHYHGYPDPALMPPGGIITGKNNPKVPCSAPHTGLYGFRAVEEAVLMSLVMGFELRNFAHVEASHGVNEGYPTLVDFGTHLNVPGAITFGEKNLPLVQECMAAKLGMVNPVYY